MARLLIVALIAFLAWQGYKDYHGQNLVLADNENVSARPVPRSRQEQTPPPSFKCDGRIYCSQMTSCQEATYFLKNCPGVKMDGNHDGVPCEEQWCR